MVDYEGINRAQPGSETDTFTLRRYRQFANMLPRDCSRVLDVGCNTGRGGRVLRVVHPDLRLTGLDCVKERLDSLPKDVYEHAIDALAMSIPVEDESFDAVVAGEFIEHLAYHDAETAISEFLRVLRRGGRLLLTTPNPAYIKNIILGRTVVGGAHLSEYTAQSMRQLLGQTGFERVLIRGTGRVSTLIGTRAPFLSVYGSYMAIADRPD